VNWVWELRPCPQRGRKIVNLFKAGDMPGITGDHLVSICRKMFTNMLRKRMESQVHLHRSGGVQKQKILHRQLVRAHASSKRLARPTKLSMFFLDAQRMIRSEGWLSAKLLEKGVMESMAGPWRPSYKSTSQVR
jgi:hypothetical protein